MREAQRKQGAGREKENVKMENTEGENKEEEVWKDGGRREEARGRWDMPDGGTQTQHEWQQITKTMQPGAKIRGEEWSVCSEMTKEETSSQFIFSLQVHLS